MNNMVAKLMEVGESALARELKMVLASDTNEVRTGKRMRGEAYKVAIISNCIKTVEASIGKVEVDAGIKKYLKKLWYAFSLPFKKGVEFFVKHYKRNLDDVFDEFIEKMAPRLVVYIMNYQCTRALKKYAMNRKIAVKKIPKEVKRKIISDVHNKYEHEVTEEAIKTAGRGIVAKMNPKILIKELKHMVKRHGWKIGLAMTCIETWEHFLLPTLLVALGYPSLAATAAVLPQGEVIIYPILFKYVFKGVKLPPVFEAPTPEGNLKWFCENFPQERLCRERWHRKLE